MVTKLITFIIITKLLYFQHPITRWLARYVYGDPQQEYEKYLHYLYEEDEKKKIRYCIFSLDIAVTIVLVLITYNFQASEEGSRKSNERKERLRGVLLCSS